MKNIITFISFLLLTLSLQAQGQREIFDFKFEGVTLNGVLNIPENIQPKGIVLLVHGAGRTNAVAGTLHADVRAAILKAGYATYMWDKMGCGKSGGTFDYNQAVQNSAMEVIAAINTLRAEKIPGAASIGLWGISRAGWINPIVINEFEDIKFWISVSGVDEKENFKYLFEQNLQIDGMPKDSIDMVVGEWQEGNRICHAGGSYEAFLAATPNLRKNKFLKRFSGGSESTESAYYAYQEFFRKEAFEKETGLQIYIKDFDQILSHVKCPVLALFGEKDKNVDWKKTKALYERTMAPHTDLTIQSFPDGNHNLFQCKTGGFYEFEDYKLPWNRSEGFLETMTEWLNKQG